MKVILSRKGIDSTYGGFPSPILPDGTLLSIPIPSIGDKITYADLKTNLDLSYLDVMKQLRTTISVPKTGRLRLDENVECHLDPDLIFSCFPRKKGWRPLFGQIGQSETHLRNQQIGKGDLFLFFGWFRETEWHGNWLRYKRGSPDLHIIFGYLQVEDVIHPIDDKNIPSWMEYHPHLANKLRRKHKTNAIYIASNKASWNSRIAGAGTLTFHESLILTMQGKSRSIWHLPTFFKNSKITYHSVNSWKPDGTFNSAKIGQEFVINGTEEIEEWAISLITKSTNLEQN